MKENLYYAEVAQFDKNGNGVGRSWGFYVSPEKYSVFTIKAAKEILEWATEEFKTRFNEDIDFNFVSLKMGDTKGKYWKDKNKLLIYKNGVDNMIAINNKEYNDYLITKNWGKFSIDSKKQ